MRVSEKITRLMFRQYLNKRDNNKGRVSEADFADWSYSTQRIIDRMHAESKMIEEYSIADYEIWEKAKALITPREIRLQDEAIYVNIKENSFSRAEIDEFEEAQWSTSNRNEATYDEEQEDYLAKLTRLVGKHNDKLNRRIAKLEKSDGTTVENEDGEEVEIDNSEEISDLQEQLIDWSSEYDEVDELPASILNYVEKPESRAVKLLTPSEYKDVQRRMLKQLSIKDGSFTKFTEAFSDRETLKTSDLSSYSIGGKTLNQPLDGFRPIALKKEISILMDMEEFRGKAETNFLNWFRSLME